MKRTDAIVTIVVFFGFLYIFAAVLFLLPKEEYSEQERRVLAEAPEISKESIMDGEFMEDLETYLADHFPGRESLVALHSGYSYAMGKRDIGGAYVCEDGYLMTRLTEDELSEAQLSNNAAALAVFGEYLTSAGIGYRVMVVPSASLQLRDKLPEGAPIYNQEAILSELSETLSEHFLDLRDVLTEERHYYKTDHHWTTEGAYDAYLAYCESVELTAVRKRRYTEVTVAEDFRGTLYGKALLAGCDYDTILAYEKEETLEVLAGGKELGGLYDATALEGEDKYSYFLGGNYGTLTITGGCAPEDEGYERRLLVIKDSYANCFLPFLTGNYGELHVLDLRYYNGFPKQYAEENGITDVLVLYGADGYVLDANVPKLTMGLSNQGTVDTPDTPGADNPDNPGGEQPIPTPTGGVQQPGNDAGQAKALLEQLLTASTSGEYWERATYEDSIYQDSFATLYGIAPDTSIIFDGAIAYGNGNANEISILCVTDESHLDKMEWVLEQRLERRIRDFEGYMPQELPKLEEAQIVTNGNYIMLVVSLDAEAIAEEFLRWSEE